MKSRTSIGNLPSEILVKIFENLIHEDLANVVLVCRRWLEIGEDPILWKEFRLLVNDCNVENLNKIIGIRRLVNIREVMFENCVLKNSNILALKKSNINKIIMSKSDTFDFDCDVTKVSANLFAETINNLETFEFYNWDIKMTQSQLTQLFAKMSIETKLKKLEILNDQNLYNVPHQELAIALNNITNLTLMCQDIHDDSEFSFEPFLNQMKIKTDIKELDISYNDLSYISRDLLSSSLNYIEKLNLFHTELTDLQLLSLFEVMNQGTAIKHLDIESHTTLQIVPPSLFSSVVNNLEGANIGFTNLSMQHFQELFSLMRNRTNLKILNIRGEKVLSSIDPTLFAEALIKVKTVNLTRCNLSHDNIKLLFGKIINDTRIEELQIAENDLSKISPKLLSECAKSLKIVNFCQSSLSRNQIIHILKDIQNCIETKIESLDLRSKYESLPEELIKNVKGKIKTLKI